MVSFITILSTYRARAVIRPAGGQRSAGCRADVPAQYSVGGFHPGWVALPEPVAKALAALELVATLAEEYFSAAVPAESVDTPAAVLAPAAGDASPPLGQDQPGVRDFVPTWAVAVQREPT
jgi:hypothetical protein